MGMGWALLSASVVITWAAVLLPKIGAAERLTGGRYAGVLIWLSVALVTVPPLMTVWSLGRPDFLTPAGVRFLIDPVLPGSAIKAIWVLQAAAVAAAFLALDPAVRRRRSPAAMLVALVVWWAVLAVSTWSNGARLATSLLVVPLVAVALWRSASSCPSVVAIVRHALFAVCYASLVLWAVRPDLALMGDRKTLTAVIPGRLVGITDHPNTLGGISAAALLLAVSAHGAFRTLHAAAAATVLVATDSSTSWAAVAIGLLVFFGVSSLIGTGRLRLRSGVLFAAIFGLAVWAGPLLSGDRQDSVNSRFELWHYSRILWSRHPFLGSGINVWADERRVAGGAPSWAGQAHNQLFDTLVVGGSAGLLALLIFLTVAARAALRQARLGQPLALSFLALTLVRSVAESPLNPKNLGGGSISIVILIALVAAGLRRRDRDAATDQRAGVA